MVRPKGGRAQPRYYYYKQAAEDKLVKFLGDQSTPKRSRAVRIDELYYKMNMNAQLVDNLLCSIRTDLKRIKKTRENVRK